MQIKTQKNIVNAIAALVVFAAFSIVGKWEQEDALVAAQQAQYAMELTKEDRAQQLHEAKLKQFNVLAAQGEFMTGYSGEMK